MSKVYRTWLFAVVILGTALGVSAQTFTTLDIFNSTNGAGPGYETLMQGPDGNLYGTTSLGGHGAAGTIFKIGRGGALSTLYFFCGQPDCTDGIAPLAGLTVGTDGDFY